MLAKQLSVFMENREGRLGEVAACIDASGVRIIGMSLAETSEYGMLRMIVSDPELAREKLRAAGLSAQLADVIIVKLPSVSSWKQLLQAIAAVGCNVEYMYTLSDGAESSLVLKTSRPQQVIDTLAENGFA